MSELYYSPRGYWKGMGAIKKLAAAARVSDAVARAWLEKQALWQVFLPAPQRIPRPKFDVPIPNEVHQADLLFLPHDRVGGKVYKYALTVVDIASRFKAAEGLTTKDASGVADAFTRIYKRGPLRWPKLLQVDLGKEFFAGVKRLMKANNIPIRRAEKELHRGQALVERFNRTLAERLFGHQYAVEFRLPEGERSREWVRRLPAVVSALNNEVTRLTGMKPADAIKLKSAVAQKPSSVVPGRVVGLEERMLPPDSNVRYLYQPGELEGGRRRATDPVWSLRIYRLGRSVIKSGQPGVYYLQDGPERGFVREELLVVPPDTQLPPDGVM